MASSKMNELDDFLKMNGFVVTLEPILSKYFGNCICEYTNYVLCTKIRLIRDRGYLYVFISRIKTVNEWYSIIELLMSLYKKPRCLFIKKHFEESDGDYFYNLISSKDKIQPDLQVKLLKRYYTEVMNLFQEDNIHLLSKIKTEKMEIKQFVETK